MIVHLLASIICAYVLWRFVLPLPVKSGQKWLLALAFLLVSQHHLISRTFFGTLASPELPFAVLVVLGWLFGAFILLAALLLVKDVAAIIFLLLRKMGLRWVLPASTACTPSVMLGGVLVLSGIGVWQAVRVPEVRTVEIVLPRLPAELDGLRVVQLSDLHASRLFQAPWVKAVVDKTNALNPDLILITGDLIDGTPQDRAADVAPLRALKARHGVFAIPGNHEYYAKYPEWLSTFADLGLRMLLNEHVLIAEKGQPLVIAGVTDRTAARIGTPMPRYQVRQGMQSPSSWIISQEAPESMPARALICNCPVTRMVDRFLAFTSLPGMRTVGSSRGCTRLATCSFMSAMAQGYGPGFPFAWGYRQK